MLELSCIAQCHQIGDAHSVFNPACRTSLGSARDGAQSKGESLQFMLKLVSSHTLFPVYHIFSTLRGRKFRENICQLTVAASNEASDLQVHCEFKNQKTGRWMHLQG